MKKSPLYPACCLVLAGSLGPLLFAAGVSTEVVRDAEQRQGQIGAQTRNLVSALDAMLGEYERNNLGGDEAMMVKGLRANLERLSVEEMRTVVDLLQQARAVQDRGAAAQTVADAFSAQKRISVEMARILAAHSRQAEAAEISKRLNDLADRQARNLRDGIQLARMTPLAGGGNFEAMRNAQLEVQRGEQEAIGQEVQLAAGRLQKLSEGAMDAAVERDLQKVAAQLKKVEADTQSAAEHLRQGRLQPALANEMTGRDELRKAARAVAPRERGAEALRKAETELTRMIGEQEMVRSSTARHVVEKDFGKWLADRAGSSDAQKALGPEFAGKTLEQLKQSAELQAKFTQEMNQSSAVLGRMEDQQGELAIQNDFLGQDLADVPKAAGSLKEANKAMQDARAALKNMKVPDAAAKQSAALESMAAARDEVRKRAEEAEMLAARGGDKAANLEMLKNAVENLAKEEAAIAKDAKPDRAQQSDVARRAEKMAERAAEMAPKAAELLNNAVANAKKSEQAMADSNLNKGREEAAQAADNLAKAAAEIAKEIAKTDAAKQVAQDAQAALGELAKLIEQEQAIDLSAAKAGALGEKGKKEGLEKLAKMQEAIQQKTEEFKSTLGAAQLGASQALNDAMADMGAARAELEAGNSAPAREAAQKAIEKMLAAKNAMGSQVAEAMKQMGENAPATPEEMAKAANQIAQALQEVNAAQDTLAKAAEQMGQKAAQNAAEAAMQAAQAAQQAADAAKAAQQQAAQAANADAAQQAGEAAQSAQAAQQAAQQAAKNAEQSATMPGQQAMAAAQQAAEKAGEAAQAAMQAAQAAGQAQKSAQQAGAQPGNAQAAQQAGAAQQAANKAAQAAQQAQQMAANAAQMAQNSAQAAQQAMQQAAQQLSQAAQQAGQAAAQNGAMSPEMMQAAQQAAQQLADGAAQAMSGQNSPAQQAAQQAAQQLSQAAAMMAAQQAGLSSQQSAGQGQQPGQGQAPGPGMKGQGQQPGRGSGTGKKPTAANEAPSEGAEDYKPGSEAQAVERQARQAALKKANFIGLPAREREAIQQSLGDKYPTEYGAMVEQYLLNLANEAAKKK